MIQEKHIALNFWVFSKLSQLGIFPAKVDPLTRQIQIIRKGWRRSLFYIWLLNFIGYMIWTNGRLVQSLVFGQYVEFYHLAFHIAKSAFFITMFWWAILIFTRNLDVNEALFNQLAIRASQSTLIKLKEYE